MKAFISSIREIKEHPGLVFVLRVLGYYLLLMILYLYFMMANLSSAPKFVYTQF
ncbi:MAG: hypothetical protein SOX32_04990 [Candidatus Choladocola sp.]|nr:hypothetical protein [Candidatus Choladocola sp.]